MMISRRGSAWRGRAIAGFALFAVWAAPPSAGQEKAEFDHPVRAREISPREYLAHVEFLAGDALRGRAVGDPMTDVAAAYIAEKFKEYGYQPAGSEGFLQPFTSPRAEIRSLGEATRLTISRADRSRDLEAAADFTLFGASANGEFSGEVVFAGYGATDPSGGYDDYAGLDVTGKAVMILRGAAPFAAGGGAAAGGRRGRGRGGNADGARIAAARARGAVAVVLVNAANPTAADRLPEFAGRRRRRGAPTELPVFHVTRDIAGFLMRIGAGGSLEQREEQIRQSGAPASVALGGVTLSGRADIAVDSPVMTNVIGILPGAGPNKDEFIAMGAHYEALGMIAGDGEDVIRNGADDNASGTAALLEFGRLLAESGPLNRSILLMAFSGEELGLLGSYFYCEEPTVEMGKIVAMLNTDMVGRLHQNTLEVLGHQTGEEFGAVLDTLNVTYGLEIRRPEGLTTRSDYYPFYLKGVPAMWFFTGTHPQYHQVGDQTDLIDPVGGAKITQLVADFAFELSSWKTGPTYAAEERMGGIMRQSDEGQATLRADGRRIPPEPPIRWR